MEPSPARNTISFAQLCQISFMFTSIKDRTMTVKACIAVPVIKKHQTPSCTRPRHWYNPQKNIYQEERLPQESVGGPARHRVTRHGKLLPSQPAGARKHITHSIESKSDTRIHTHPSFCQKKQIWIHFKHYKYVIRRKFLTLS